MSDQRDQMITCEVIYFADFVSHFYTCKCWRFQVTAVLLHWELSFSLSLSLSLFLMNAVDLLTGLCIYDHSTDCLPIFNSDLMCIDKGATYLDLHLSHSTNKEPQKWLQNEWNTVFPDTKFYRAKGTMCVQRLLETTKEQSQHADTFWRKSLPIQF